MLNRLISGVIDFDKDVTWMVFLENADGTGSTLLDNAGAYYPEHILLNTILFNQGLASKLLNSR